MHHLYSQFFLTSFCFNLMFNKPCLVSLKTHLGGFNTSLSLRMFPALKFIINIHVPFSESLFAVNL